MKDANPYRPFFFVHVPKTGGTSIARRMQSQGVWGSNCGGHCIAIKAKARLGKEWDERFSFGFIRNPWSRAFSIYNYWMLGELSVKFPNLKFTDWIRKVYGLDDEKYILHPFGILPQTTILCDSFGIPCVDFVGRFEDYETSWDKVCREIGIPVGERKHTNKSNSKITAEEAYSDDEEAISFVGKYYREDVIFGGYSPPLR